MIITGRLNFSPKCPHCKETIDGFTGEGDVPPSNGDITICIYCFEPLVLDEREFRVFRDEDFEGMPQDMLNEIANWIKICRLVMEDEHV